MLFEEDADSSDGGRMSVVEHLTELRSRLFKAIVAIAAGAVVAFIAYNAILDVLKQPYCDAVRNRYGIDDCTFLATSVLDPFALRIQIATYGGLILASPIVFWQIWRFVAPGLKARERRYAVPFITSSVLLFALGGLIAYYTFPAALRFLISIGGDSLEVKANPTKYLSLVSLMILAFGVSFQFPVFLVFLQLIGALSSARLRSWRRWAAVLIVAFAALITPSQDPISLFAMAGPMYAFYEIAILIGRLVKK